VIAALVQFVGRIVTAAQRSGELTRARIVSSRLDAAARSGIVWRNMPASGLPLQGIERPEKEKIS
jgi:hypothetical protein